MMSTRDVGYNVVKCFIHVNTYISKTCDHILKNISFSPQESVITIIASLFPSLTWLLNGYYHFKIHSKDKAQADIIKIE